MNSEVSVFTEDETEIETCSEAESDEEVVPTEARVVQCSAEPVAVETDTKTSEVISEFDFFESFDFDCEPEFEACPETESESALGSEQSAELKSDELLDDELKYEALAHLTDGLQKYEANTGGVLWNWRLELCVATLKESLPTRKLTKIKGWVISKKPQLSRLVSETELLDLGLCSDDVLEDTSEWLFRVALESLRTDGAILSVLRSANDTEVLKCDYSYLARMRLAKITEELDSKEETDPFFGVSPGTDLKSASVFAEMKASAVELPKASAMELRSSHISKPPVDDSSVVVDISQRDYQREVFEHCKKENSIVFMPTGAGKTRVAVAMIQYVLSASGSAPRRWIAFLAPTVVLVRQHFASVKTAFRHRINVAKVCGDSGVDEWDDFRWKKLFECYDVFVMTPQCLVTALQHGFRRISDFSLLVFDECHHVVLRKGKLGHPYHVLMSEYYKTAKENRGAVPQILGLTASLIKSKTKGDTEVSQKVSQLKLLLYSQLVKVEKCQKQLDKVVSKPQIWVQYYVPSPTPEGDSDEGDASCEPLTAASFPASVASRCKVRIPAKAEVESLELAGFSYTPLPVDATECTSPGSDYFSLTPTKTPKWLKALRKTVNGINLVAKSMGGFAAHVSMELWKERLELRRVLLENGSNISDVVVTGAMDTMSRVQRESAFVEMYADWFQRSFEQCAVSHKLQQLEATIARLPRKCTGIIFVERRLHAAVLAKVLCIRIPELRFAAFTSTTGDGWGTTSTEQPKVLAAFRRGHVHWLLSTAVGEEGVDISACSCVVRWDLPKTSKEMIQSRGRARRLDATFVFMLPLFDQESAQIITQFFHNEQSMQKCASSKHPLAREKTEYLSDKQLLDAFPTLKQPRVDVEATGAFASVANAKQLVFSFCQRLHFSLPKESVEEVIEAETFEVCDASDWLSFPSSDTVQHKCTVHLAADFPCAKELTKSGILCETGSKKTAFGKIYVAIVSALVKHSVFGPQLIPTAEFMLENGTVKEGNGEGSKGVHKHYDLPRLSFEQLFVPEMMRGFPQKVHSHLESSALIVDSSVLAKHTTMAVMHLCQLRCECLVCLNIGVVFYSDTNIERDAATVRMDICVEHRTVDDLIKKKFERKLKHCTVALEYLCPLTEVSQSQHMRLVDFNHSVFELFDLSPKNSAHKIQRRDDGCFECKPPTGERSQIARNYLIAPICEAHYSAAADSSTASKWAIDWKSLAAESWKKEGYVFSVDGNANAILCYGESVEVRLSDFVVETDDGYMFEERKDFDYSEGERIGLSHGPSQAGDEKVDSGSDSNNDDAVYDCDAHRDSLGLFGGVLDEMDLFEAMTQLSYRCRRKGVKLVDVSVERKLRKQSAEDICRGELQVPLSCLKATGLKHALFYSLFNAPSCLWRMETQLRVAHFQSSVLQPMAGRKVQFHSLLCALSKPEVVGIASVSRLPRVFRQYEGYEWLGDAVLKFMCTLDLFCRFPQKTEGELSALMANVVSNEVLLDKSQSAEMRQTAPHYFADFYDFNYGQFHPPTHCPRGFHSKLRNIKMDGKVAADLLESILGVLWFAPFVAEPSVEAMNLNTATGDRIAVVALDNVIKVMKAMGLFVLKPVRRHVAADCVRDDGSAERGHGAFHCQLPADASQLRDEDEMHVKEKANALNGFLKQEMGYALTHELLLCMAVDIRSLHSTQVSELSFERLEFLGDAVLGLLTSHCLLANAFHRFKNGKKQAVKNGRESHSDVRSEGELSVARTKLVCNTNLMRCVLEHKLFEYFLPSAETDKRWHSLERDFRKKMHRFDDFGQDKKLADIFEAVLGAVFLDCNWQRVFEAGTASLNLRPCVRFLERFLDQTLFPDYSEPLKSKKKPKKQSVDDFPLASA